MRFIVTGWFDGRSECEPPELDKRWLVVGCDDDEFCILVQRRVNGVFDEQTGHQTWGRATVIAEALNEFYAEMLNHPDNPKGGVATA